MTLFVQMIEDRFAGWLGSQVENLDRRDFRIVLLTVKGVVEEAIKILDREEKRDDPPAPPGDPEG